MNKPTSVMAVQTRDFIEVIESDLFKAVFEPIRIQILVRLFEKGGQNIAEIAEVFPQDRSVISRHLKQMHDAGVLAKTKVARDVIYSIDTQSFPKEIRSLLKNITAMLDACCP